MAEISSVSNRQNAQFPSDGYGRHRAGSHGPIRSAAGTATPTAPSKAALDENARARHRGLAFSAGRPSHRRRASSQVVPCPTRSESRQMFGTVGKGRIAWSSSSSVQARRTAISSGRSGRPTSSATARTPSSWTWARARSPGSRTRRAEQSPRGVHQPPPSGPFHRPDPAAALPLSRGVPARPQASGRSRPAGLERRLDATYDLPGFASAAFDLEPLAPGSYDVGPFVGGGPRPCRHAGESFAFRVAHRASRGRGIVVQRRLRGRGRAAAAAPTRGHAARRGHLRSRSGAGRDATSRWPDGRASGDRRRGGRPPAHPPADGLRPRGHGSRPPPSSTTGR